MHDTNMHGNRQQSVREVNVSVVIHADSVHAPFPAHAVTFRLTLKYSLAASLCGLCKKSALKIATFSAALTAVCGSGCSLGLYVMPFCMTVCCWRCCCCAEAIHDAAISSYIGERHVREDV